MWIRVLTCVAIALLSAGCTTVPGSITTPVPGPDVEAVRKAPDSLMGSRVRWGGTISSVENRENGTLVTVVARRITRRGEPLGDQPSTGRFLAHVDRFLDPEEYGKDRRVTVVGRIVEMQPGKIGEYVYDYPLVQVDALYLWEEYVRRDPYPYYRWPYHDPFWPYGYPWHRHRFHGYHHYPWHY